jgi:hypothetical protein
MGELSGMLPFSNGMATYCRAAFGPWIGYLVAQMYGSIFETNLIFRSGKCMLMYSRHVHALLLYLQREYILL